MPQFILEKLKDHNMYDRLDLETPWFLTNLCPKNPPNFLNNDLINAEVETINLGHLASHLFLNPSLQIPIGCIGVPYMWHMCAQKGY